jgi:hypothetical protein
MHIRSLSCHGLLLGAVGLSVVTCIWAEEQDAAAPVIIELANGHGRMTAPPTWKSIKPAVSLIKYEFVVPAAKGDERPGRVTIMSAGGSIEQNLQRWSGQFKFPPGAKKDDAFKVNKQELAGQIVHTVDAVGEFQDRPGGFRGPVVPRPGYRMLGAIIETKSSGNHFIKFYGPEKTVSAQQDAFAKMLKGLNWGQ